MLLVLGRHMVNNHRSLARLYSLNVYCKLFSALRPNTVRHTFQITSVGGVATTFLYEYALDCGVDIFLPYDGGLYADDYGIWKHLRVPINAADHPNLRVRPKYRVLYVVGNPYNSVCSLFRRGFHYWALERLFVPQGYANRFQRHWNLKSYLENGEDLFLLSEHVTNWTKQKYERSYPVLVVKYEAIPRCRDVIMEFMGIEPRKQKYLEFWRRSSDYRLLPQRQVQQLKLIYGDLADYIDSLPDYFLH
jgi:hypothetical protein